MPKPQSPKNSKKAGKKFLAIGITDFAAGPKRHGSIDHRDEIYMDPLVGVEWHKKIQEKRRAEFENYTAEAQVGLDLSVDGWTVAISGRIDGLIRIKGSENNAEGGDAPEGDEEGDEEGKRKAEIICEEIKTTYAPTRLLAKLHSQPDHVYWLQLLLYNHILRERDLSAPEPSILNPRLLIVHAHTGDMTILRREEIAEHQFNFEEWINRRAQEVIEHELERRKHVRIQRKMAEKLQFPHVNPRKGQGDLLAATAECVAARQRALFQAPTGLGKTAAVMFPSLRDSLQRGSKLIYVTPKNTQHTVAEQFCSQMQAATPNLRSITLAARSKLCLKEEQRCNPDYCEYASGHYDKVEGQQLLKKLSAEPHLSAQLLQKFGQKYQVCPYELGMQSVQRRDVIIGDYNYAFSPHGSIIGRCVDGDAVKPKPNLVIDEAHNLYARAQEYFSPVLTSTEIDIARQDIAALPSEFQNFAEKLLNRCAALLPSPSRTREQLISINMEELERIIADLSSFSGATAEILASGSTEHPLVPILWILRDIQNCLTVNDGRFFTIARHQADQNSLSSIQVFCSDAGIFLNDRMREYNSVIAFSATLRPFEFYMRLSGFTPDTTLTREFMSPFPPENRKILIIPQVSTTFQDRPLSAPKIREAIARLISARDGNYFVFFPSFEFMNLVTADLSIEGATIWRQPSGISSHEARSTLLRFKREKRLVVCTVQGGVFSEGIDLPGDQLIGAIVVGPAVPNVSLARECMRQFYQRAYGDGFDYAYTYPAMAKVVQSAGRVIRTEEDRGLIILMDRRFLQPKYSACLPSGWYQENPAELVSTQILRDIADFWQVPPGAAANDVTT